jgi:siroheme synthase (precorrin-2 oxidase/ferrochelatase)
MPSVIDRPPLQIAISTAALEAKLGQREDSAASSA